MKKLLALIAVFALAYVAIGAYGTSVTAAPAFVLNSGRDGLTCTLSGTYNGSGDATLVITSSGNVTFRCRGGIVDPPPDSAIVTTATGPFGTACSLVITPSANFSASCH